MQRWWENQRLSKGRAGGVPETLDIMQKHPSQAQISHPNPTCWEKWNLESRNDLDHSCSHWISSQSLAFERAAWCISKWNWHGLKFELKCAFWCLPSTDPANTHHQHLHWETLPPIAPLVMWYAILILSIAESLRKCFGCVPVVGAGGSLAFKVVYRKREPCTETFSSAQLCKKRHSSLKYILSSLFPETFLLLTLTWNAIVLLTDDQKKCPSLPPCLSLPFGCFQNSSLARSSHNNIKTWWLLYPMPSKTHISLEKVNLTLSEWPLLLPNPVTLFLPPLHLGALILSLLTTYPCLLYNQKLSSPSHPQPSCLLWVIAPESPLKEAYSFLF